MARSNGQNDGIAKVHLSPCSVFSNVSPFASCGRFNTFPYRLTFATTQAAPPAESSPDGPRGLCRRTGATVGVRRRNSGGQQQGADGSTTMAVIVTVGVHMSNEVNGEPNNFTDSKSLMLRLQPRWLALQVSWRAQFLISLTISPTSKRTKSINTPRIDVVSTGIELHNPPPVEETNRQRNSRTFVMAFSRQERGSVRGRGMRSGRQTSIQAEEVASSMR